MQRKINILRWLPAVVMMGLIFAFSAQPAARLPYFGEIDVLLKKAGHALGYALLGLSYYYALPQRVSRLSRAGLALLMVLLFALSDEFHQSFVQGRTSSLRDVAIDLAGAGAALLTVCAYSSNSSSNSSD
ncbi:MAG: VanZ family protein [Anaerolineales bacterium]|nr:VanZ family protein [Anaerolineales bacterium]